MVRHQASAATRKQLEPSGSVGGESQLRACFGDADSAGLGLLAPGHAAPLVWGVPLARYFMAVCGWWASPVFSVVVSMLQQA